MALLKRFSRGVILRVLGKALHITSRGLVARADSPPKVGQIVLDSSEKRVGNVLDVFGPVKSPYFVVKPASGVLRSDLERLVGSDIYMGEEHAKGRKSEKVSRVRKHETRA